MSAPLPFRSNADTQTGLHRLAERAAVIAFEPASDLVGGDHVSTHSCGPRVRALRSGPVVVLHQVGTLDALSLIRGPDGLTRPSGSGFAPSMASEAISSRTRSVAPG